VKAVSLKIVLLLKKMQQTGCSSIFAKYQGQLGYVEGELISSGRKIFWVLFRYMT